MPRLNPIRILVVDDEDQVCKMLQRFLTWLEYDVKTALNGEDALAIVKDFEPHFVILDVMIPVMSGIEILQAVLKIDNSIQVIMISGMHDLGMAKEAMSLGALDYLLKPVKLDSLQDLLKQTEEKLFDSSEGNESERFKDD